MSLQSIISTPLPLRPHGIWSRIFELHKLLLALLLGMFIGANGLAWSSNLGWLQWRSAKLGQQQVMPTKPSKYKISVPNYHSDAR